jgi:hypothetical protein
MGNTWSGAAPLISGPAPEPAYQDPGVIESENALPRGVPPIQAGPGPGAGIYGQVAPGPVGLFPFIQPNPNPPDNPQIDKSTATAVPGPNVIQPGPTSGGNYQQPNVNP